MISELLSRLRLPTLNFWEWISGLPIPTSGALAGFRTFKIYPEVSYSYHDADLTIGMVFARDGLWCFVLCAFAVPDCWGSCVRKDGVEKLVPCLKTQATDNKTLNSFNNRPHSKGACPWKGVFVPSVSQKQSQEPLRTLLGSRAVARPPWCAP